MGKLIYLIGFMGSGKSTVGKMLARKMDYRFIDLDAMIESNYRITIPDLFNRFDEAAFRKVEQATLKETFDFSGTVVSTGGGTPCFFDNMELINRNGTSVYLKMHPRSLFDRLMSSKKKRPLLEKRSREDILDYITGELEKRDEYYMQAHHIVKGENLDMNALLMILNR